MPPADRRRLIDETLLEAIDKMEKAVEHVQGQFATVRTGRATPALVEKLMVDYYGSDVPLQQLAGFQVPEARLLVVKPHDRNAMGAIEKAIRDSDLGIAPNNDGIVIRLAFPALTEERRREYVKVVKHIAEDGRVAVRNIRRDARKHLEASEKEPRDLLRRARSGREGAREDHPRARREDRQGPGSQGARAARGVSRRRLSWQTSATSPMRSANPPRARRSSATRSPRCASVRTTPAPCRTGRSRPPARCRRSWPTSRHDDVDPWSSFSGQAPVWRDDQSEDANADLDLTPLTEDLPPVDPDAGGDLFGTGEVSRPVERPATATTRRPASRRGSRRSAPGGRLPTRPAPVPSPPQGRAARWRRRPGPADGHRRRLRPRRAVPAAARTSASATSWSWSPSPWPWPASSSSTSVRSKGYQPASSSASPPSSGCPWPPTGSAWTRCPS